MIKNINLKKIGLILIPFFAFISLGLPDGLLGVAWPGIREKFNLSIDSLGIILIVGTCGYMISSFFSGLIMSYLRVGIILSLSCSLTALSLLVFSQTPSWLVFIFFSFINGLSAGTIDSVVNTYVAKYHSSRMMQWLHASFGIGITSGPIIMTLAISMTSNWQIGYLIVSATIGILTIFFFSTKDIWKNISLTESNEDIGQKKPSLIDTMRGIPVKLSMLMFFLYTGVELGIGHWIYSLLIESRKISSEIAGIMASCYWATFTFGRIVAGLVSEFFNTKKLIFICSFLALLGISLIITNLGDIITIFGISLTGFSFAPIFPSMVSETSIRVGMKHHANTIGLQMSSAGLGMALIPSIAGVFAKNYGLEIIPIFLFGIFLFMLLVYSYLNFKYEQ